MPPSPAGNEKIISLSLPPALYFFFKFIMIEQLLPIVANLLTEAISQNPVTDPIALGFIELNQPSSHFTCLFLSFIGYIPDRDLAQNLVQKVLPSTTVLMERSTNVECHLGDQVRAKTHSVWLFHGITLQELHKPLAAFRPNLRPNRISVKSGQQASGLTEFWQETS